MRWRLKSKKFQTWSEIAKRGLCENIVAFDRSMPAIDRVKQFNATQVSRRISRAKFSRKRRLSCCKRFSGCSSSAGTHHHVQSTLLCPIEMSVKSGKRFIVSKSPICPEKLRVRRILRQKFCPCPS